MVRQWEPAGAVPGAISSAATHNARVTSGVEHGLLWLQMQPALSLLCIDGYDRLRAEQLVIESETNGFQDG